MTTGVILFICRRETLGSHRIKSSISMINGAACIDRSAESGAMASSVPVAIPDERDSADAWYLGGREGVTSKRRK